MIGAQGLDRGQQLGAIQGHGRGMTVSAWSRILRSAGSGLRVIQPIGNDSHLHPGTRGAATPEAKALDQALAALVFANTSPGDLERWARAPDAHALAAACLRSPTGLLDGDRAAIEALTTGSDSVPMALPAFLASAPGA